MLAQEAVDHSATVARHLPYLRRYARALTGNQTSGDQYAVAVLESIVADPEVLGAHRDPKVSLFAVFHSIWSTSGAMVAEAEDAIAGAAQAHLAALTPNSREALLLSTIEGFGTADVAAIMGTSEAEAAELIDIAIREMEQSVRGAVLVIEDEAIIAMDISAIVEGMGHRVTATARTHREAVRLAAPQGARAGHDYVLIGRLSAAGRAAPDQISGTYANSEKDHHQRHNDAQSISGGLKAALLCARFLIRFAGS